MQVATVDSIIEGRSRYRLYTGCQILFFPPKDPQGSGQKATPTSSQQLAQRNERRPSLFSMTFIQIFPLAQETNDPTQKNEGFVLLRHQDV